MNKTIFFLFTNAVSINICLCSLITTSIRQGRKQVKRQLIKYQVVNIRGSEERGNNFIIWSEVTHYVSDKIAPKTSENAEQLNIGSLYLFYDCNECKSIISD